MTEKGEKEVGGTAQHETLESSPKIITLIVNNIKHSLRFGDDIEPWKTGAYDVYPWDTLAHTLRERLAFTGTKVACDNGACGSCTVLMDGKPILSCSILTADCDGHRITTIEGLGDPVTEKMHPIQQAFIEHHGIQCGFCIPGMILSTKALLDKNPNPTEEQVKEGLSGNLCRCGNYSLQIKSVMEAAKIIRKLG